MNRADDIITGAGNAIWNTIFFSALCLWWGLAFITGNSLRRELEEMEGDQ